jgi:hypothetical protein
VRKIGQPDQGLRCLVAGGLDFEDELSLRQVLDWLKPVCVIHGDREGASRMAGKWAQEHGVPEILVRVSRVFAWRPDKTRSEARSDRLQAQWLFEEGRPDLLVAFPGGTETRRVVDMGRWRGIQQYHPLGPPYREMNARAGEIGRKGRTKRDKLWERRREAALGPRKPLRITQGPILR